MTFRSKSLLPTSSALSCTGEMHTGSSGVDGVGGVGGVAGVGNKSIMGGARVLRIIIPKRMFDNDDSSDDDNKEDNTNGKRVPKTPPGKPRENSSNKPYRGRSTKRRSHKTSGRPSPASSSSSSSSLPCDGRPYQYIDSKTKQHGTVLSALGGHILQKYYLEQHKPKSYTKRSFVPKIVGQSTSSFMSSSNVKRDTTRRERSTSGLKPHKRRGVR